MDLQVYGNRARWQTSLPETPRSGRQSRRSRNNNNKKLQSPTCKSPALKHDEEEAGHCRPNCVPTLDLGYLQEPETKPKQLLHLYDYIFDNSRPASTISCGTPGISDLDAKLLQYISKSPSSHPDVPSLDIQETPREPAKTVEKVKENTVWENAMIPEDLPRPSEKYQDLYRQYEEEMRNSYRKHMNKENIKQPIKEESRPTEEKSCVNKVPKINVGQEVEDILLEQSMAQLKLSPVTSTKKVNVEEFEESKKKEKLIEAVMVDQLSRGVLCDPEQNKHMTEPHNYIAHKPRGVNRFLHESSIKTRGSTTENLLSKRVRFGVRILSQNGHDALRELMGFFFHVDNSLTIYEFRQFGKNAKALPFIQRGRYLSPTVSDPTRCYSLCNIYPGANLEISSENQMCLSETLKKKPTVIFRVTDVAEKEKSEILLANVRPSDHKQVYAKLHIPQDMEEKQKAILFVELQQTVRDKLKKRGIRTMTGLGQYYRKLCQNSAKNGHLSKSNIESGLQDFHIDIPQTILDKVYDALTVKEDIFMDYSLYMRAVIGEMNEYRKNFVRKAYQKMGGAKNGNITVGEMKKFYNAGSQTKVVSGGTPYDALELMLGVFKKTSKEIETIEYIEWEEYYEGLSIGIESDAEFVNILKNLWSI